MKNTSKTNEIIQKYENLAKTRKEKVRSEPKKSKRFWKWIWYWLTFPFVWIFYNIRDWRTFIIFAIVFIVISSEVWVPYLIGVICWANEPLRISMFSVGSACWLFWLGPGTPFMVICITLTIGVKALFNKIKRKGVK